MSKPERLHILVVALTDEERATLPLMLGYAVATRQRVRGTGEDHDRWDELARKIVEAMESMEIDDVDDD